MSSTSRRNRELPPRARRILGKSLSVTMGIGTTSACAENTWGLNPTQPAPRNYLRVRGEYFAKLGAWGCRLELPPRARRIPISAEHLMDYYGTTSACAENTFPWSNRVFGVWNYLRVRGEYTLIVKKITLYRELPPRARRIHGNPTISIDLRGTTSACAENTP